MNEEMAALESNDIWELVPFPNGKKAIGCKWVYKLKQKADGNSTRQGWLVKAGCKGLCADLWHRL